MSRLYKQHNEWQFIKMLQYFIAGIILTGFYIGPLVFLMNPVLMSQYFYLNKGIAYIAEISEHPVWDSMRLYVMLITGIKILILISLSLLKDSRWKVSRYRSFAFSHFNLHAFPFLVIAPYFVSNYSDFTAFDISPAAARNFYLPSIDGGVRLGVWYVVDS